MSTNFYFRDAHAAEYLEVDHIGLSTSGLFLFEAIPSKGLTSFEAWQDFLCQPGRVIVDEGNNVWSLGQFIACAAAIRKHAESAVYRNAPILAPGALLNPAIRRYRDAAGYLFCNYTFC